jgi:hypothetical protein
MSLAFERIFFQKVRNDSRMKCAWDQESGALLALPVLPKVFWPPGRIGKKIDYRVSVTLSPFPTVMATLHPLKNGRPPVQIDGRINNLVRFPSCDPESASGFAATGMKTS